MQTANERVFNVTRRFSLKWKQAVKAVENCAAVWVEPGKTIRDVKDIAELQALRAQRAHERQIGVEVLVAREVPGCMFKGPKTSNQTPRELYEELDSPLALRKCNWPRKQTQVNQSFALLKQANQFCQAHASA